MTKEYRRYGDDLKEKAVTMHLRDKMSLHRVARELGVSDASVIRKWVRAKQRYGDEWLRERRGRPRLIPIDLDDAPKRRMTIQEAKERIRQLESEVERLRALLEESAEPSLPEPFIYEAVPQFGLGLEI